MLYFTGVSHMYLVRIFLIRFLIPGVIFIIIGFGGVYYFTKSPVVALLAGYALSFIVTYIQIYFMSKGTQYILTNKRLISQQGYFNVSLTSAVYDKITHVEVYQSFIERSLYKYGRLMIHTAGSKDREIVLENIAHPLKFKNILEKLIDEGQSGYKEEKENIPNWKNGREHY